MGIANQQTVAGSDFQRSNCGEQGQCMRLGMRSGIATRDNGKVGRQAVAFKRLLS